ncbi:MAG: Re/Si-specific NAD(P)(+) transhydrogenase subunit alpha [Alphaproteobacteria bacterium]|nr:Re/Si-specific NAD(P)(+) transhydrogenase subunit alpha [Alphaproteobacteria bacterium]
MKIGVPKERRPHERRVAATPDSVKRLVGMGAEMLVETGAGAGSNIPDDAFVAAGAKIAPDEAATLRDADIVLKVQRPMTAAEGGPDEVALMKKGAILVGLLSPHADRALLDAYAKAGIVAFSMEFTPRITRAQAMDALSSQSNLAGYKAVIDAAAEFGRAFPMMMTAAGTIAPARVVILGAGVAGLQAIATARRLGAIVSAFDVRAAAKEQVESLGASFVEVSAEDAKVAETAGGYAKEMSEDYKRKQAQVLRDHLKKQDVVVTTALIPGKPAPRLIDASMVAEMKPGAVIVDLAVESGGNCELSEFGKIVVKHGVTIVGHPNVPSRIATDASALYARNLWSFVSLLIDAKEKALKIDWEDEIVKGMLLTREGAVVHPALAGGGT